jgi:hypothetical protein
MAVPQRFTNYFIYNEINRLKDLISGCERQRKDLRSYYDKEYARLQGEIDIARIRDSPYIAMYGALPPNSAVQTLLTRIENNTNRLVDEQERANENKLKYEKELSNLNILLQKTEEQRAKEYYQSLIDKKRTANDAGVLDELAKEFREMEGYADTKELARECESQAVEARYNQLNVKKNRASTEAEYQNLTMSFRAMNGYKNTAELASECEKRYRELKEYNEEQARKAKAERERRAEQEKKEQEESERREVEERERIRIEEKNKKTFWTTFSLVLGGVVGGSFLAIILHNTIIGVFSTIIAIISGVLCFLLFIILEGKFYDIEDAVGKIFGATMVGGVSLVIGAILYRILHAIPFIGSIVLCVMIGTLTGYLINIKIRDG